MRAQRKTERSASARSGKASGSGKGQPKSERQSSVRQKHGLGKGLYGPGACTYPPEVVGADDPRAPSQALEASDDDLASDAPLATQVLVPERATHTTSKGPPPTLSPAVQSGDRLGRYVLLDIIGTGGMSVVYRAIDPELARHVAIKILRRGETKGDGTTRSRWRARLASSLLG